LESINQIGDIRFRAFRAIEDRTSCERYFDGHQKVLKIFDIAHITSAKPVWMDNPNCYLVMAESLCGEKIYGGARVQVADGTHPLPIEDAVGDIDKKIFPLVVEKTKGGTGELCGLWNSREVAGMGIGSIFLGRTSISIVNQLRLTSLFALCAPATLRNCLRSGFEVERSLGNSGSFYYPKLDLIATALLINDAIALPTANEFERQSILDLRKEPRQIKEENLSKGPVTVSYDLIIKQLKF
jgi:hypothetical protein